jgi:FG-GAP repeat
VAQENPTRTGSFWSHSLTASLVLVVLAMSGLPGARANTSLDPMPEDSTTLFGAAIAAVGDLNGDGVVDLAVGAPFQDGDFNNSSMGFGPPQNVGKVFLLSGADLAVINTLDDPDFQMVQNLKFGGHFGEALAAAGDLNGDGVSEVMVGNPHHIVGQRESSIFNAGRAMVFNGATGSILFTLEDPTPQEGARLGAAVAGLGDVNADGVPDLLVAAPKKDTDAGDDVGTVYIFSGANGSLLRTLTPPAEGGAEENGRFGHAVANAGDVNHDGVSDLLIGAPGRSRAYVYNGASGALLFTINSPVAENPPSFGFAVAGVRISIAMARLILRSGRRFRNHSPVPPIHLAAPTAPYSEPSATRASNSANLVQRSR